MIGDGDLINIVKKKINRGWSNLQYGRYTLQIFGTLVQKVLKE